jgi:LysR family transcriptional regulator, nitrogen assimilation regulatory protein
MDLRQIAYFVALFEEGSVTRAAQRLHVVQPALSMQMAKLERELEQKLFERTPKSMVPTTAARTLYRLVNPILRDLANAREQMARLSSTISGRVTIGVLSSIASSVVPDVLARFVSAYPEVEISMADGYSSTFIEWVGAGTLDLAIINKPRRKLGLVAHHLLDEEMVVVAGHDTVLPVPMPVTMKDLAQLNLILPSKRHGLRIELDRHFEAEGLAMAPKLELDSPPAIADFVARTDWFTVLPSLAVGRRLVEGSLKAYRIVTPRITRQLVAIHAPSQPMSPAAARLFDFLAADLTAASRRLQPFISGAD